MGYRLRNSARRSNLLRQNVSLREIAVLASVDISTASRALNHDIRVSTERAAHIRKVAERVGYRPRPLRSKSARAVGLLVCLNNEDRPVEDYLVRIACLTQSQLASRNLHANLERVPCGLPIRLPAVVTQNRVDGVILSGHPPVELIDGLRALAVPAVAINDTVERLRISCVRSNPEPAMREAILQLAARGHESFALMAGNFDYPTIQARYRSYQQALREIEIQPRNEWLVSAISPDIVGGAEGARLLRNRGELPTAILCENDWMALGAVQFLQREGVHIPWDVSVVGHDDMWICEQMSPPLTSIHRNEDEIVGRAIDLLLEEMESEGPSVPREVLLNGKLMWRGSSGPASQRISELAT
ncbi:MAG TPA: LacI family DNA-binding transcriptional regulator [Roseimicrobium sp.]|nr:LacI family DNA-binding transcriptional regulator [Roseimicrobium sp.]